MMNKISLLLNSDIIILWTKSQLIYFPLKSETPSNNKFNTKTLSNSLNYKPKNKNNKNNQLELNKLYWVKNQQ